MKCNAMQCNVMQCGWCINNDVTADFQKSHNDGAAAKFEKVLSRSTCASKRSGSIDPLIPSSVLCT